MLKRIMTRSSALAIAILLLSSIPADGGSEVGDVAPALIAGGWINSDTNTSWDSLQGKLILIEKWATW